MLHRLRTLCRQVVAARRTMTSANASATASLDYDSAFFQIPNDQPVVLQQVDSVAHIVLNRPKALNALNLQMIQDIYPKLQVKHLSICGIDCI